MGLRSRTSSSLRGFSTRGCATTRDPPQIKSYKRSKSRIGPAFRRTLWLCRFKDLLGSRPDENQGVYRSLRREHRPFHKLSHQI